MSAATSSTEIRVVGPLRHAQGVVALPGSKSISNRTLLLAALAHGTTQIESLLDSDDVQRMLDALVALGVTVRREPEPGAWRVGGTGGRFPSGHARLFLGNAGTAVRPLTAVLAVQGGDYEIRGNARMHERPIGHLVDALRSLGCRIDYLGNEGYPPLAIGQGAARAGATVPIRGDVSSQFLSALLMALPLAADAASAATAVRLTTPLISRPYVGITINLMRRFGVEVASPSGDAFVCPAGARYVSPGTFRVEGDASSASYFLAAGVLGGGPVRVTGVGRDSVQGDVAFAEVLGKLGARLAYGPDWIEAGAGEPLRAGTIDCTTIPDAAMTLAIVALFAHGTTTLTGIGSWRVKETDRIAAMASELAKLGASVVPGPDSLAIAPPPALRPATIDTYDDHRIAMCFSLAAFGGVPVTIRDPGCVRKTFPDYFTLLDRVSARAGEGG